MAMNNWDGQEELQYPAAASNQGGYQSRMSEHAPTTRYQPYQPPLCSYPQPSSPPPLSPPHPWSCRSRPLYRPQFQPPTHNYYPPQPSYGPVPGDYWADEGGYTYAPPGGGSGGRASGGREGQPRASAQGQSFPAPRIDYSPAPLHPVQAKTPPKPQSPPAPPRTTQSGGRAAEWTGAKERVDLPAVDVKTIQALQPHRERFEILMDFYGKVDSTMVKKEYGRWEVRVRDAANSAIPVSYYPIDDRDFHPSLYPLKSYVKMKLVWRHWGLQCVGLELPREVNFLALLPQRRALAQQTLARRLPGAFAC